MAILPIHEFFILDSKVKPVSEFISQKNEGGIYEVLRVEKGVPLFLSDHLERFSSSAKIQGIKIKFSLDEIKQLLNKLISLNQIDTGNILISCKENLKAFFIPHQYPLLNLYKSGINCGFLQAERKNPNAKVFQTSVRQQADVMIAENAYYEVLLVDSKNRITEGSRSNVFFISENKIITPPGNEVLLGITRSKAISIVHKLDFNLEEKDVYVKDLETFQAAFITGTSPKLLPVRRLESYKFDPQNKIVQELMADYELLIQDYIRSNQT